MALELLPITEDEARIGDGGTSAPPAAARVAFEPVQFEPVDPLQDFEIYNALEDEKETRGYDPRDPGIAAKLWAGVKGLAGAAPGAASAVAKIGRAMFPQLGIPIAEHQAEAAALGSQVGGQLLKNYSTLGQGAKAVAQKGAAAATALINPELEPEMKQLSRRAAFDFQSEARDAETFAEHFNQHLETLFPGALEGLGSVPVDQAEAAGLALFADPANLVPAGAAARWTSQVPLRGAVRAATGALKEASLELAKATAERESLTLLLKPGLTAAERGPLFAKYQAAEKAGRAAAERKLNATKVLGRTAAEQRAVVDDLATQASQLPLVTRGASMAAQGAGAALDYAGAGLQRVAAVPDKLATMVAAGADEGARQSIADGVRNVAGGLGIIPGAAGAAGALARNAGRNLAIYGRLLAEAEGQLPFFKKLARETTGLTSWGASLVDQSGMGQTILPAVRAGAEATRGMPFAAGFGYVGSGGEDDGAIHGAGAGMVLGLAGAGYGQWQRLATGAVFRQRQMADIQRYRQTLPTSEARTFFDNLPGSDRAAVATMQLAHPDLKIQYSNLGKERPSFYYAADDGPVAVVNLETKEPLPAILAHEIGHHVERHGQGPVIERTLLGDPNIDQPGMFTKLGADGRPVRTPEGAFELNDDWAGLRGIYDARLQALADRTGEVVRPRTDAEMAREIFAEHAADYLLGRDGQLTRDLRANVWSRALGSLAGSEFIANVPTLRSVLGKLGVALTPGERRVVGSELFPGGLPASNDLQRLISKYHRKSAAGRVPGILDEPGNTRYSAAELQQYPQILEKLFDGTDDVKRGPGGRVLRDKRGAPIFNTPKEQAALRGELARELEARITAAPPVGARVEKVANGTRIDEGWVVPGIPEPVLDDLKSSGRFNPYQIENLRQASRAIADGRGRSLLFFYQPALQSKQYASLAGDWRTETPYAIFVSKAGNVLLRTMSREKLMTNVQELVAKKRANLWDNNISAVVADVERYLGNHAAGKPGADGIGVEKRDQINALFGIDTYKNRSANPLLESSPKAPIVIRSRRLDRTNRLTPLEEYFPTSYDRLNANLRPE